MKIYRSNNKKGFTLAEILVIVAIIGILVAVSIPIFTAQVKKAKAAVDIANERSASAAALTDYIGKGSQGNLEYYYDAASGTVTTDYQIASKYTGYGKSSATSASIGGAAGQSMPYYAGYAGIVRININNGIPVLTWDVPGVTVVTAANISGFVTNGVLTLNRTGLKTLDLQKGALQGIKNKAAVTQIIFGTDTAYNEETSNNKQGTGIDFRDQFKGFTNVTYLDFTGTQVGKVNPGDWNDLRSLKTIKMPATIVDSYNLPGKWYFMDSAGHKQYLSAGVPGSSRVYATKAAGTGVNVSGKTIYRE